MRHAGSLLLFICVWFLPVQSIHAQSYIVADEQARLLNTIQQLQQQLAALEAKLQAQQAMTVTDDEGQFIASVSVQARYTRSPGEDWFIENTQHRSYIHTIQSLWPKTYFDRLQEFIVFDESRASFDAYVETADIESNTWSFGVGDELVEVPEAVASKELILHELAHVFAHDVIFDDSVMSDSSKQSQRTYLDAFTQTFWSPGQLADAKRITQAVDSEAAAYRYYQANPGEFVTDYAASSPEEDFAESFMFYVHDIPPGCTDCVAAEKIEFFSQYPELYYEH